LETERRKYIHEILQVLEVEMLPDYLNVRVWALKESKKVGKAQPVYWMPVTSRENFQWCKIYCPGKQSYSGKLTRPQQISVEWKQNETNKGPYYPNQEV